MLRGKRIVVVMPAYRAERTLHRTYEAIPREIVDEVILTDDASADRTAQVARELGIRTLVHETNRGYGANQKTCYAEALKRGADVVVMLHADYQYDPRLVTPMAGMVASDLYDVVLGSRILGGQALKGGMPYYKYISNRFLTMAQNILMGAKLSEYHTGYRAFTRKVLETVPIERNSDDFVFDNQMLSQIHFMGFSIAEVTCPAKYFEEASSINFRRSLRYGLGCMWTALQFRLTKMGLYRARLFAK